MKRPLMILVLLAIVAGIAILLFVRLRTRPEWTTSSPQALEQFEQGLDARMRLYADESLEHLRKAVELDPNFVAARVILAEAVRDHDERQALLAPLGKMDLSDRSDRERFLAEVALQRAAGDSAGAEQKIREFVHSHPEDPWGLYMAAGLDWESRNWDRARELYLRLLEVDPNWVLAHNHLGYLAMAQGRFAEAEERFRTYAYVAPDQANPHDSLGELLVLLGRYDEARKELETALSMRPDFCASYNNLLSIAVLSGHPEDFDAILARVDEHCPAEMAAEMRCESSVIALYFSKDFDAIWREPERFACLPEKRPRGVIYHRLALLSGHDDEARAEEKSWAEMAAKAAHGGYGPGKQEVSVIWNHVEGVRRLAEGQPGEAAANFRAADRNAVFWGTGQGRTKLFNLLNLALALQRGGDLEASKAVLDQVRAVNPAFVDDAYPGLDERTPGPRLGG